MKRPDVHAGFVLLILMGVSLACLFAVLVTDYLRPPMMVWEAVSVVNSPVYGEKLVVAGRQSRRPLGRCTNNFQTDMRRDGERETRLPVPIRVLNDAGDVRYDIVLPDGIEPGAYEVRVKETFGCGGPPDQVPTPWLSFVVR